MDELFKDVKKAWKKRQDLDMLEERINNKILEKFINVGFHTELLDLNCLSDKEAENVKVYFPILDVPKGWKKENEQFTMQWTDIIKCTYAMSDEYGNIILFKCEADACNTLLDLERIAYIRLKKESIVTRVVYTITIAGDSYRVFIRNFSPREMLPELLDEPMSLETSLHEENIDDAQNRYDELLKNYGGKHIQKLVDQNLETCYSIKTGTYTRIIDIKGYDIQKLIWYQSDKIKAAIFRKYNHKELIIQIVKSKNKKNISRGTVLAQKGIVYEKMMEKVKPSITWNKILEQQIDV